MQDLLQKETGQNAEPTRSPLRGILVGAAILVMILATFLFLRNSPPPGPVTPKAEAPLAFGTAEQAYTSKIYIGNITLHRAENFLHQEVTTLTGELLNGGDQTVVGLQLTVEFSDQLHQVVLREKRVVLDSFHPPFAPGQQRAFEFSFEHIPSSWNMQQPAIRISALRLNPEKQ